MYREILVIDDNPDIRILVSNILRDQNFKVRTAANYDQAVNEINKKLPDLAIIDIKLDKTDKDGIDLLKLITKNFWLRLATDQVAIILEELAILELVKLLEEGENCRLVSQKTKLQFVC